MTARALLAERRVVASATHAAERCPAGARCSRRSIDAVVRVATRLTDFAARAAGTAGSCAGSEARLAGIAWIGSGLDAPASRATGERHAVPTPDPARAPGPGWAAAEPTR